MKTNDEYILVNKTKLLEKRNIIQDSLYISESMKDSIRAAIETFEIHIIDEILSESTLLINSVEKT